MRSELHLVADRGDDGSPVLARCHAVGQLTARRTAPGVVHLVGRTAGPLGGDETVLRVLVRAGARLELRSVAATLVLPGGREALSRSRLELVVEVGAELVVDLQPVVVCAGAAHESLTRLEAAAGARADVTERVQLGRHGEPGGSWRGRLVADVGGGPALRHTLASSTLAADGHRAWCSTLQLGAAVPGGSGTALDAGGYAAVLPLAAGGRLVSAAGRTLRDAGSAARAALLAAGEPGDPAGRGPSGPAAAIGAAAGG